MTQSQPDAHTDAHIASPKTPPLFAIVWLEMFVNVKNNILEHDLILAFEITPAGMASPSWWIDRVALDGVFIRLTNEGDRQHELPAPESLRERWVREFGKDGAQFLWHQAIFDPVVEESDLPAWTHRWRRHWANALDEAKKANFAPERSFLWSQNTPYPPGPLSADYWLNFLVETERSEIKAALPDSPTAPARPHARSL